MYTLTKADVLLVAGELANLDDPRWGAAIEVAKALVSNTSVWGGDAKAKKAATYLAAHLAKLELVALNARGATNSTGPVVSIKLGPAEKQYASLADFVGDKTGLAASLALTPYGITFSALQRVFAFTRAVLT